MHKQELKWKFKTEFLKLWKNLMLQKDQKREAMFEKIQIYQKIAKLNRSKTWWIL